MQITSELYFILEGKTKKGKFMFEHMKSEINFQ